MTEVGSAILFRLLCKIFSSNKSFMSNIVEMFKELIEILAHSDIEVKGNEIEESWMESCRIAKRRKKRLLITGWLVTASVAAMLALVYFAYDAKIADTPDNIELYVLRQQSLSDSTNSSIQLIMSEGEVMTIGGSESNIDYACLGKIIVDNDTITEKTDDLEPRYNQLIVPHGKRTHLHLADGTRLCVNSGTRVVYPLRFGTGDRKILIEGEAYLEVAKDESRPFIVKTEEFEVKVLGTKFNVFAYPNADRKQVVLVDGSVLVNDNRTYRKMKPGELVEKNSSELTIPKKVDTESYISWINNIMVYKKEPLNSVFDRLHHYYGLNFKINCDISNIYISGKLDLQETVEDVLASIASSVPVECVRIGNDVSVSAEK